MEDNKQVVEETTMGNDATVKAPEVKVEKTFTRDEFNRAIAAEKTKLEKELTEKAERERTEAEKLASMKAEERLKYEAEQERAKREQLEKQLNAFQLRQEAQKIALSPEYNLDVELLDLIDYSNITAEKLNEEIGKIKTSFDKAIEKRVNDRLKETAPKQVADSKVDTDTDLRKYIGLN